MTSERPGTFVFIQLPSTEEIVVAGRYELDTGPREHVGYFTYGRSYLARDGAIPLDPIHLPLRPGEFRTTLNRGLFGALRDAAPDYWGRLVIERQGIPENELDYLLATPDVRVGALSFAGTATPPALDYGAALPVEALAPAADAASGMEARVAGEAREFDLDPALLSPSSGVGGARPKTIVMDAGQLWIAKLPSRNDRFNNAAAEATCLRLAQKCGIEVPDFRVENVGGRTILLVRRFDQRPGPVRRPVLSAHTLLGLGISVTDRAGWSYVDLAHALRRVSVDPGGDARALYRRAIFNALISNTDDHPRNHAVVWRENGWKLSPAYDLTPGITKSRDQRLLAMEIGTAEARHPRWANRANILSGAGHFGLSETEADDLISEMKEIVVSQWRGVTREVAPDVELEEQIAHAFPEGYPGFEYSSLG